MSYSGYFFCAATNMVHQRWLSDSFTDEAITWTRSRSKLDEPRLLRLRHDIELGRQGIWPTPAGINEFDALLWMLDASTEVLRLQSLHEFRHFQFLKDTGVWSTVRQSPCPIPMPVGEDLFPIVGWLAANKMSQAATDVQSLPEPSNGYVRAARFEFLELLESLAEDQVDLFAVFG